MEQADGYDLKFADGVTDLPQCTNPAGPNYFSPGIYRYLELTFENVHNFTVPDHGGKNITLVTGRYRKTNFVDGGGEFSRMAAWVRPYWDDLQQKWSDSLTWDNNLPRWREITECDIFEIVETASAAVIPKASDGVTFADDAAVGTKTWQFPSRAATKNFDGTYCQLSAQNQITHYLKVGGVDLSTLIPGGTTISGVEVFITHQRDVGAVSGRAVFDDTIKLTKNGAVVGTNHRILEDWTGSWQTVKYGSPTDTWGAGLLQADTLGVAISAKQTGNTSTTARVDYVTFIVYYKNTDDKRLVIDDGQIDVATLDPTGKVFNSTYFKGWTIVYESPHDDKNYDRVVNCGFDSGKYFLELAHPQTDYAYATGTRLYLYRNFTFRDLPFDITSFIYTLFNEARITTGNNATDASLMAGFRTADYLLTDGTKQVQIRTDGLLSDVATLDVWPYAGLLKISGTVFGNPDPPPSATYYFKYALRMDDGSISKLYDAFGGAGNSNHVTVDGLHTIALSYYRSLGAWPRRAKSIILYESVDGKAFYQFDEIDLTIPANLTAFELLAAPFGTHYYAKGSLTFDETFLSDANPLSITWDDKADDDDGVIRFSHAMVLVPRVYAAGVYDPSQAKYFKNQIFASAIAGDANKQYDVFPNDDAHLIDLEFSDGDEVVAIGAVDQLIVAIKKRSIVTISQDAALGFVKQLVSKGYGISSFRTLISFDDTLTWLDYNAVIRFSTRGVEVLNHAWIQDLRDMSDAVKEAAIAVFDRVNRQYRLSLNGRMYVMDYDTKEWTIQSYALPPARFAADATGSIDFLNGSKLLTVGEGEGLQQEEPYDVSYETNEFQHGEEDEDVDLNVTTIICRYRSDVDLTLRLYRTDTATEIGGGPWTLPSARTRVRVKVMNARCSSFRLKLEGTIHEVNQRVTILRLGAKYEIMPSGGSELSE